MTQIKGFFTLKTGVQLIGLFDALLAFLVIMGELHFWMHSFVPLLPEVNDKSKALEQVYVEVHFNLVGIILTLTSFMFGTALCAYDSTVRQSKWFVLPWLLQNSIVLSIITVLVLTKGFSMLINQEEIAAVDAIFIPLAIVIRLYQVLTVYKFYKKIKSDGQADGNFTATTVTTLDEVLVLEEKPSKKIREAVLKSI